MSSRLELRELGDHDADLLRQFRCTGGGASAGVVTIERSVVSGKVIRALASVPGSRAVGALLDGVVVGVAFTEPLDSARLPTRLRAARFIRLFAVHDDAQGQQTTGVGRVSDRLLTELHGRALTDLGSPCAMLLRVDRRNNRAAAFFARHRYESVPDQRGAPVFVRELS